MRERAFLGVAIAVCLMAGTMPALAAAGDVVLYASDAVTLRGHWTRAADTTAAGGELLKTTDAGWAISGDAPSGTPANFVEFTFNADANTPYRVWVRLRALKNSKWNDSAFAQFSDAVSTSGAAMYRIGTTSGLLFNLQPCNGCVLKGWGWVPGAYWLKQTTTLRFAASGAHTLRIQTREDGVQLDQVVLSPVTYLTTSPGQRTGDSTIIPKAPVVVTSTPYSGIATPLPGTVQAENFDNGGDNVAYFDTTAGNSGTAYRQTAVDIEASTEGGYNVGWIKAGEWLAYSVNVSNAGTYLLEARVASLGLGGAFHVEAGGKNVTGPLQIPDTGGWQNWTTVSATVSLSAGPQIARIVFDTNGPTATGNVNWFRVSVPVATPYTGIAVPVPGTIMTANFDNGGEGLAYHDTTPGNSGGAYRSTDVDIENGTGGMDVSWISGGEWLGYSVNVSAAGSYVITARVASTSTAGRMRVSAGSTVTPQITIPNTGGTQNWSIATVTATLAAGPQTLKLHFDVGGFSIASVNIAASASAPPPPPPPPPPGGNLISVPAGANLQTAINNAQPGDTLLLAPGATYVGNFVLPVKNGTSYITIQSAAPATSLPDANTRMTPAYASFLPKLKSPNSSPAIRVAAGAHHYRLLWLEFLPNYQGFYDVIALGDGSSLQNSLSLVPHDLIVDRVYIHGDPVYGQKRGIALNSASTSILNSYISGMWAVGQDSQAISGWNGPGPYTISNNYLEAAGENLLFGGSDPSIPNLVPSDITITRNHLFKPLSWRSTSASVKNILELKNAQRVVITGNILENNWVQGQDGTAVLFTPRNQDGGAPWVVVQQVEFSRNIVRHVSSAINILGNDYEFPSQTTNHITIRHNLFEDISGVKYGGSGRFLLINGGTDITVDHNTVFEDGSSTIFADEHQTIRFTLTNNILQDNAWGVIGSGTAPGNGTITSYFPNALVLDNAFVGSSPSSYPTGNYYPANMGAVGFVNFTGGNYALAATSPYVGAATDGTNVGVDTAALATATAGVKQ